MTINKNDLIPYFNQLISSSKTLKIKHVTTIYTKYHGTIIPIDFLDFKSHYPEASWNKKLLTTLRNNKAADLKMKYLLKLQICKFREKIKKLDIEYLELNHFFDELIRKDVRKIITRKQK